VQGGKEWVSTRTTKPIGDLSGWSNPTSKATPEGGTSKVTEDPQGNPVSIFPVLQFSVEMELVVVYSYFFLCDISDQQSCDSKLEIKNQKP
jgi:hypothetical protein